jgi:SAM-dependent methyltransferase
MTLAESLASFLVDPVTHEALRATGSYLESAASRVFRAGPEGYFDFTLGDHFYEMETTSEEYADEQRESWRRFYSEYLRPWVRREDARRILEVGCGMGMGIRFLRDDGFEAYGVDIPCLSRYWARAGNDPAHFFTCDGAATPFPDRYFDAVYTLGTIEHIGTTVGHYTLNDDYWDTRIAFAKELLRVTRANGRILVSCPNKAFPIDIHHGPTDSATPADAMRFRRYLFNRYGMTLHKPFGKYHLLSYGELRGLFCQAGLAQSIAPLPLKNYFAFKRTGSLGPLRPIKRAIVAYIESMPALLRRSPLNPFLVVEVRR